MGNAPTKTLQKRGKKYVHWSNAERPSPPGKPQLVPGTPQNQPDVVTIRWTEPTQDGGAPITGYLVEHRRTGSPHWVRATPTLVTKPELTLSGLEPGWRYQFRVSAENDAGVSEPGELSEPLTVTLQRSAAAAPHFTQELAETIVLENEKAEFCVHFRGTPTPKISWFKDGFEIFSSRRTKIVTENEVSTLVIFQAAFNDEGEIKCTATNRVGHVVTKTKLRLEAPPRIRLPRQYEDGLLFEMDEIIRLKVSVAGRPLPRVTWLHNADPVVFGGRHEITNTERSSSLRVGEARREDRGEYQVRATSRLGEDSVSFLVTVTDRPVPPGKAKVVMTLGRSVTLSWIKPDDDGGCKIGNYIVEYYRLGWNVWLKAATCRQLTTTLGDLIEGSEYKFRVKAENPYGVSDPSEESEVVFIPDPKRGLLEAPARGSKPPEITAEQLKEDRKRRPIPSPEPGKFKREKHSDSSMEYPSSDADSVDVKTQLKKGDTRAYTLPKANPESQVKKNVEKAQTLIPLTVVEHDSNKGEPMQKRKLASSADGKALAGTSPTTENKRRKEKENMDKGIDQLKPELPPKAMKSSPKQSKRSTTESETKSSPAKAKSGSAQERDAMTSKVKDADYKGLSPEVYSLKIPVKKGIRLEDLEVPRETQSNENRRLEQIPREEDDSLMHGSSEMMLVLLPQTRDDQAQTDRSGRGGSFSRSFDDDNHLGVAPPMSLSAPELGCAETLEMPPLRNAISSTELLHEKTMARFFLEAAAEEVAQSIARRRRSTTDRQDSIRSKDKPLRLNSLADKSPEKVEQNLDKSQAIQDELLWHNKKQSPEVIRRFDTKALTLGNVSKGGTQLTDEEQEEADFARLRQRIAKTLEDDFKAVENEMRYMKKERLEREEDEEEEEDDGDKVRDDEEEDEDELGEEEEEEDMEEEEESLEDESIESDEEDEDDEIEEEEEPYHPSSRAPPLRSMEATRISDDEEEPYHPRGMASRVMMVKEIPPPIPIHREVLTVKTINDSSKSSSPVRFEPKLDLQPKPILKTTSKFEIDEGKKTSKSDSTRASTPFGTNEKKPKKQILNKILNKIEAPFKRSKTPPVDPKDADAVVRRKKKDQLPETKGKVPAQEAVSQEGDVGLSAAEIARKRRLQTRKDSLEEDMEGSKILISLYSDIVKEYGAPRKTSPILLLNTEQLKAAAEDHTVDLDISISPEPIQEPLGQTHNYTQRDIRSNDYKKATPVKSEPNRKMALPQPPDTPSPPPPPSPQEAQESSQGYSEEEASEEELSEEEEEVERWEFTPRKMIARLRRSLTPKHSFRRQRSRVVNDEEEIKMAETRVHHFISYLTDLAMFLVACWLYLFKDERLAIPVLLLMVYRQMHEAIMQWVPQRWRRQN